MQFSKLAKYLQRLEDTTKRLEMISILAELIEALDQDETEEALFLASGYLKAPYEGVKFNIADKMMARVIAEAYSNKEKQYSQEEIINLYKSHGDMGNAAFELAENREKATQIPETADKEENSAHSIQTIHQKLLEIAQLEGAGSQDSKVTKLANILKTLDKISAKYIVRIVLGTTRLGFTETTILEALAQFLGNRKLKKEIESYYNIHPNIGLVAKKVKSGGLEELKTLTLEPGIPVLSQKAQRVGNFIEEAMERIPQAWAEYKYDGTRVQLHLNRDFNVADIEKTQQSLFTTGDVPQEKLLVKTYTRNLEETTHQYPDIVEAAKEQIDAESVILDGEAIGYDEESDSFLPFQETMQRKRKHGIAETALEIPIKYYVFDILYLNGKPVMEKPLRERKKLLEQTIKPGNVLVVANQYETKNIEELKDYYEKAKEAQLEGLIVKNPEDPYQAGARSYSWVKLKTADETLLEDALDCVVLGYYLGKGVRAKFGIGGFLVGVYDPETDMYRTVSKVGTGLKEADWIKMKSLADNVKIAEKPANVDMDRIFTPDVYVKPQIVVEIGADEISKSPTHTAGYALRFPRLIKFRPDKAPVETTSLAEVEDMFNHQRVPTKS
jgi:DNA ligase 1